MAVIRAVYRSVTGSSLSVATSEPDRLERPLQRRHHDPAPLPWPWHRMLPQFGVDRRRPAPRRRPHSASSRRPARASAASAASTRVATRSSAAGADRGGHVADPPVSTARSCSRPRIPTTHTVDRQADRAARDQSGDRRARREPGEQPGHHQRDPEPESGAEHHHQLGLQPP